jgi:hypothetical protein
VVNPLARTPEEKAMGRQVGDVYRRLVQADLALIGATEGRALLLEARSLFPSGLAPERRRDRWAAMDRWTDDEDARLKRLDDAHRRLGWSALTVRLHRFLTEHGRYLLEPAG